MDLLEFQGKQLFAKAGVAVPEGEPAADVDSAVAAADRIGYPCVIKAQVLIGGRGKAGGIKVAKDQDEARAHADAILGMDIVGPHGEGPFTVHQVWVEGASDIDAEYYASIILDRSEKKPLVILSADGRDERRGDRREGSRRARPPPRRPLGRPDQRRRELPVDAGIDEDVVDGVAENLVKLYGAFDDSTRR